MIYVAKFERFDFHCRPALKESIEIPLFSRSVNAAYQLLHSLERPLEGKSSWLFQSWTTAEYMGEELDDE